MSCPSVFGCEKSSAKSSCALCHTVHSISVCICSKYITTIFWSRIKIVFHLILASTFWNPTFSILTHTNRTKSTLSEKGIKYRDCLSRVHEFH